jgi:predicted Rossmann fold nucleotide-binding protein DprA/Smf involved in DNA uptake
MTTIPLSADGQAIALACSNLALQGNRELKPLSSREWHELSAALVRSDWESPRDLLGREPPELRDQLGVAPELAMRLAQLLARGGQLALELERLASHGIWVLTRADERYPPRLKKLLLGQAPPVLYGAGPQTALREQSLAVVGSRDADAGALAFARTLSERSARQDIAIVSGGARGVDLEAILGALDAGGIAIGVTVEPLERLVRRAQLRSALGDDVLTLVTPFHPSARWNPGNAMRRNRLVYVMAQAAVVAATAAGKGGTWTGAIENLQHHWVPVYVRDDDSPGSRELARAGAVPIHADALEDLSVQVLFSRSEPSLLTPTENPQLGEDPLREEILVTRTVHSVDADTPEDTNNTGTLAAAVNEDDAFWVMWPILQRWLQEPRSDRDVAKALNVQLGQARVWLDRAVDEQLAEVRMRPKRYLGRRGGPDQLSLG